ncbi:MAG: hypothetical protein JRN52_00050 [Nitrososphaerota archaeon]|nr:hypothetical protein [Nitrososphaerota archaeon]
MTQISIRLKQHKRAITPVIATIILIAVTLVLALVVGAYAFGLFGSNVKTVTLTSGNLFAGSLSPGQTPNKEACTSSGVSAGEAYLSMALNDPGATTNITSFTLTGASLKDSVAAYVVPTGKCLGIAYAQLNPGSVTALTLAFNETSVSGTDAGLISGQTYNYVIDLGNGQSVSGSLIAQ